MQPTAAPTATRPRAGLGDYVALARPSHWVKHVFILPGIALAVLLREATPADLAGNVVLGFFSAALAASANYVLNEWLDAKSDAFHPEKASRPAAAKRVSPFWVACEYAALVLVALLLASTISRLFAFVIMVFLAMAWLYNVPPVRTKDHAYLDVLSEAVNNPIRLTLGWAMVDSASLPPSSLLLTFWMGGSFLMAMKRLAEFRSADRASRLPEIVLYRRSFRMYGHQSLLLSSVLYAQMTGFFLAIFLVKYRIEYVLTLPVVAALFCTYLWIALRPDSPVQTPEKLIRERALIALSLALALLFVALTWIDLPILEKLASPHFIELAAD